MRDIGLIGTKKGWNVLVGGTAGIRPRIGDLIAEDLSDEEVLNLMGKIIAYYKENEEQKRLGKFIDHMGFKKFKKEIMD